MRLCVLTIGLVLPAILGGCGSSQQTVTGTEIPSPAYAARTFHYDLKAVCAEAQHVLGTVSEHKAVWLYHRYVSKFKALSPPPGERAAYSKFVDSLEQAFTDFEAGKSANPATATAQLLAQHLDAEGCGQIVPELGGY